MNKKVAPFIGDVPYALRNEDTRGFSWLKDEAIDHDDFVSICEQIAHDYIVNEFHLPDDGTWHLVEGTGWGNWRDGVEIAISMSPSIKNEYDGTVFEFFLDRRVSAYGSTRGNVYLQWSIRKLIHTDNMAINNMMMPYIIAKSYAIDYHNETYKKNATYEDAFIYDLTCESSSHWNAEIVILGEEHGDRRYKVCCNDDTNNISVAEVQW